MDRGSRELEYVPAKLIVRQTVRPKFACRCGCGGVVVAPLPPRLLPQSKLVVGLAVHLLLRRFDDHVPYYTLERIFRERHDVVIPRQQMVQWVERIAFLLQPLYRLMFDVRGDEKEWAQSRRTECSPLTAYERTASSPRFIGQEPKHAPRLSRNRIRH